MKYQYELKRINNLNKPKTTEIKKSFYKNPLSIFAAIIMVTILLYVSVNIPGERKIRVIKAAADSIESLQNVNTL